jgi:hypothetical protein
MTCQRQNGPPQSTWPGRPQPTSFGGNPDRLEDVRERHSSGPGDKTCLPQALESPFAPTIDVNSSGPRTALIGLATTEVKLQPRVWVRDGPEGRLVPPQIVLVAELEACGLDHQLAGPSRNGREHDEPTNPLSTTAVRIAVGLDDRSDAQQAGVVDEVSAVDTTAAPCRGGDPHTQTPRSTGDRGEATRAQHVHRHQR